MFHQSFYPHHHHQQQQGFHDNRSSMNFFMQSQPFFYRSGGPVLNQSTHNLNFTHDFERFSTPHHGRPSSGYPYFDYNYPNAEQQQQQQQQQRWRHNMSRAQQQQKHRRTPAFHFQDQSTSYYMTDPIKTSDDRITIQLTKVHIGPNGDQQRVFVEQDFSNENELNKFVRNLRHNFDKTFNKRSSDGSSNNENTDENKSTDSKKSGMVVVEEPDEEPKIYQQQVYNAKIESKQAAAAAAAAAFMTPPLSPTSEPPPAKFEDRSRSYNRTTSDERHHRPSNRAKYTSPPTSHMSSSSTTHSNQRHKNKMKYRRQPADNKKHQEDVINQTKSSRIFKMPSFTRRYQATPAPSHFQQRFFNPDNDFRMKTDTNTLPNPNISWRYNQTINGCPKNRSRSYVPPINDHIPPPPPPTTPFRFHQTTDPFFRSTHPTRFTPQLHRQKDSRPPPSPSKFCHTQRRKTTNQPTTITENLVYPNNEQQQPRVHRTKSECRNSQKQQRQKSRSTTNQFQIFSPLQQPPIIQRHFIPFRSPPFIPTSTRSTAPMFYPNQRRQFGSVQVPVRLINPYRLGSNRF